MIGYLVTRQHSYTIIRYADIWAPSLAERVRPVFYDDLVRTRALPAGTFIVTDLERLTPEQLRLAVDVERQLIASGRAIVLNSPRRVLLRYDLQAALRSAGVNDFAVHRWADVAAGAAVRFPAFVRRENDHAGGISDLLIDRAALDAVARTALAAGTRPEHLLVVEFCDTRDDRGLYRKYSVCRIGDRIVPRHALFGEHWMLKHASVVDDQTQRVEYGYLRDNPHEAEMRRVFDVAGIDYGRIDYAVTRNGRVQVWEINTNPFLNPLPGKCHPPRLRGQGDSSELLRAAFEALDDAGPRGAPIPLTFDDALCDALGHARAHRAFDRVIRTLRPTWQSRACRPLRRVVELIGQLHEIDRAPHVASGDR